MNAFNNGSGRIGVAMDRDIIATEALTSSVGTTPSGSATMTVFSRRFGKTHALLAAFNQSDKVGRRAAELRTQLRGLKMLGGLIQVSQEHQLSAPLVATMRVVPGFEQAVQNFPKTDVFSVIPEHPTDANNVAGMESLGVAEQDATATVRSKSQDLATAFAQALESIGTPVADLLAQTRETRTALENSDVTDDVLTTLSTQTLSADTFTSAFNTLDGHLKAVGTFEFDSFQAHPETIGQETLGMTKLAEQDGGLLGLTMGDYGLEDADQAVQYEPTPGTFGDKGITKAALESYLAQTESLLTTMQLLSEHKDELTEAMAAGANDVPQQLTGSDVVYGCVDHMVMLSSYGNLTTKALRETMNLASMVLTTVDAALNIDDGTTTS